MDHDGFSSRNSSVSAGFASPNFRMTDLFQFAWDFLGFGTPSSVSQEPSQVQENQHNLLGIVLVLKQKVPCSENLLSPGQTKMVGHPTVLQAKTLFVITLCRI